MQFALKASLLAVFGSAVLGMQALADVSPATNSAPAKWQSPVSTEVAPRLLMARGNLLSSEILNDEAADSTARASAVMRHSTVAMPVEAVPAPTAWATGGVALLALASVQAYRKFTAAV